MYHQSDAEIRHVCDEWVRNFVPQIAPRLILTDLAGQKNFEKISQRCLQKGHVSISYLTESYNELAAAGQLELTPEPRQLTQEEQAAIFQAKEFQRIQKEQQENAIPFKERVKAEKAKREVEERAKIQADAKGQLAVAISGYQCYRLNGAGIDYTATEMVQKELRGVRVGNDFVRALAVVRQIIQELPDHPKMGDVARVVESLNARSVKSHQRKDSFGDEAKEVGKLGGLR